MKIKVTLEYEIDITDEDDKRYLKKVTSKQLAEFVSCRIFGEESVPTGFATLTNFDANVTYVDGELSGKAK